MAAHPELASRIEQHADQIAARAVEAFRADPFAAASLVPLAELFSPARVAQDVAALVSTLRSGDAPSMLAYVREMQRVVPNGGLTSRHLSAGFRRLHDAIVESGLSEAGAARTMLDRATLALRYDGSSAASVQDASRQLAEDAVVALRGVHLGEEAEEAQWIEALELVVSYLADSLGQQRPEILARHMRHLAQSGPSIVRPADPAAILTALAGALDELPGRAREDAAACLRAAHAAIATPVG